MTQTNKAGIVKNCSFFVLEINWLAASDTPFSSSKTTYRISATSCWVLKPNGTPPIMDSFCFKTHKKLDGSTGLAEFLFTAMLRLIACNICDKVFDSEGILFKKVGITPKICKMEL